jgi:hypothetical protein
MKTADLKPGTAYVVDKGYPTGKAVYIGPSNRSRKVRMDFQPNPDKPWQTPGICDVGLPCIAREWDHPEEIAKRQTKLKLDERSERARDLLDTLGFTVGWPGQRRRFEDPKPSARVVPTYSDRVVEIDLDAFLAVFDVPDLAAVMAYALGSQRARREASHASPAE